MTITKSGTYDLTMSEYRGQPADAMSMASSDAIILTDSTPAHLQASWADDSDDSKEADLGTIIHTLILEPHRKASSIAIAHFDDWRTKDARAFRDDARAAGRTPILNKHFQQAMGAVSAVNANPVAAQLLAKGKAEQSWFAKDRATGLYLKARTDFFTEDRIILDVKSVASASPEFLQRRVYDGGWFQQSPWYCDVVERVDGSPAKGYAWIIVEQKPPHSVVIRRPDANTLMHGHRLNQKAFATFARCVKEDQWPSWSGAVEDLTLPTFAMYRLEEQGVQDDTAKRGLEALAWAEQTGAHPFS